MRILFTGALREGREWPHAHVPRKGDLVSFALKGFGSLVQYKVVSVDWMDPGSAMDTSLSDLVGHDIEIELEKPKNT